MTDNNTAPRATRTLADRKADLEKSLAKVNRLIAAEQVLANIAAGDVVTFRYGRAEKVRELTGVVQGLRTVELTGPKGGSQRQASIVVGEGFDAETYKVRVADILNINGGEQIEADDEAVADEAGTEGDAPAGEGNDPLDF